MSANRRQFIGAIGAALAAIGFSPKEATAPKKADRFSRHPVERTPARTGAIYTTYISSVGYRGDMSIGGMSARSHFTNCPAVGMFMARNSREQVDELCRCKELAKVYFVPGDSR